MSQFVTATRSMRPRAPPWAMRSPVPTTWRSTRGKHLHHRGPAGRTGRHLVRHRRQSRRRRGIDFPLGSCRRWVPSPPGCTSTRSTRAAWVNVQHPTAASTATIEIWRLPSPARSPCRPRRRGSCDCPPAPDFTVGRWRRHRIRNCRFCGPSQALAGADFVVDNRPRRRSAEAEHCQAEGRQPESFRRDSRLSGGWVAAASWRLAVGELVAVGPTSL